MSAMMQRALGQTAYRVSVIGLRGWPCEPDDAWAEPLDANELISATQVALEGGVTYLEWPLAGGNSQIEESVSNALSSRREHVVLAGVCGVPGLGTARDTRVTRPDMIVSLCEAALRRLRQERFDVLHVRWPGVDLPIPDLMGTLAKLLERGDIGAIGLSHYGYEGVSRARRVGAVHVVRTPLSLFEREATFDLVPFCQEHGIAVVADDVLAGGWLASDADLASLRRAAGSRPGRSARADADHSAALRLQELAQEAGRTVGQLATAWAISEPGVSTALAVSSRPSRVQDQLGALGWTIPEAIRGRLDDILSERDRRLDR